MRDLMFKYLQVKRHFCFINNLINSDSDSPFQWYFRFSLTFYWVISKLMIVKYRVVEFLENPFMCPSYEDIYIYSIQRIEPWMR